LLQILNMLTTIYKTSIGLILLLICSGCAYVERTLGIWPSKRYKKVVKIIDKQKQCISYIRQYKKKNGDCILSHWQCLPNQKGQLTVVVESPTTIQTDTLVDMAFRWNPQWEFIPIRKQSYRLQKEEAIYWADGSCRLSADYLDRYGFIPSIYRQLERKDTWIREAAIPWQKYELGDYYIKPFHTYGSEEGHYVDAKKEGLWVTKTAAKDTLPAFVEKVSYTNGAREGRAYHYFGTPPKLRQTIPYQDNKVNGWVYIYDEEGVVADSALYKNDRFVK